MCQNKIFGIDKRHELGLRSVLGVLSGPLVVPNNIHGCCGLFLLTCMIAYTLLQDQPTSDI